MNPKLTALALLAVLPLTSCDKIKKILHKEKAETVAQAETTAATPTPVPTATPEPTPVAPTPTPRQTANKDAQVVVFCYHRFEGKNLGYLSIPPELFDQQMQQLKDAGITVIPMADFIAWKRGEKTIPVKSAVITIDDGYESGYAVAWPILKKYGYPFTVFIYTKFVSSGGKSITWEQLEEMRDAGIDIESHTETHPDLRKKGGKSPQAYDAWLTQELKGSKDELEQRLGIKIVALAFPYGGNNQHIRDIGKQAGYQFMFTVYGQKIAWSANNDMIGRYAVEFAKPEIYQTAVDWSGIVESGTASEVAQTDAPPSDVATQPKNGETVSDPSPVISADLSSYGDVTQTTVAMRVSGLGLVPATLDPKSKVLSYKPPTPLTDKSYTVIVTGKTTTGKVDLRWTFNFNPAGASAPAAPAAH